MHDNYDHLEEPSRPQGAEETVRHSVRPAKHGMPPLLTVTEAAQYLRLAKLSVYQLVSQKRIPVVRLSARCIRFRVSDLEEWIASHLHPARDADTRLSTSLHMQKRAP